MKHKVRALVEVEKRGIFGKKKVYEQRTVSVDGRTYKKLKKAEREREFGISEMMLYDALWDDEDI